MPNKKNIFRSAAVSAAALLLILTGFIAFGPDLATQAKASMEPVVPELAPASREAGIGVIPTTGTFAPVVDRAAPAVVSIRTSAVVKISDERFRGSPFFRGQPNQPERRRSGAGSGVIVSGEGLVITNNHVVEGAQEIEVTLGDKRTFPAELVGGDAKTDIAVLRIKGEDLPTLPLGNSDDVRVGDVVLAIGNPFGIGKTVTMGIVGATSRGGLGIEDYEDFIQTDAAINPGNSGGALVSTDGRLIGINTAILSRSGGNNGVGFAVPVNLAHHVMRQIAETGEVRRGFLGVGIQDLTPAMAKAFGVDQRSGAVVSDVTPDSPARDAGIERGDVITSLNGKPIEDARELRLDIAAVAPDTEVELGVLREGKHKQFPVTVGQFPDDGQKPTAATSRKTGARGLTVRDLSPEIARELGLDPGAAGAVITAVQPGSSAAEAGLRRGDVIQEAGRQPVTDVADLRKAVQAAGDEPLLLLVNRGGRTIYVALESR
jgi:serine protease Do